MTSMDGLQPFYDIVVVATVAYIVLYSDSF